MSDATGCASHAGYQSYTVQWPHSGDVHTRRTRNGESSERGAECCSTRRAILVPQTGHSGSPPGMGRARSAFSTFMASSVGNRGPSPSREPIVLVTVHPVVRFGRFGSGSIGSEAPGAPPG